MLRKIIGTTGTRVFTSVVALLVLVINSNYLGSEGVGTIGLIIFSILLVIMVSNFVGGSALVYLAPRHLAMNLLLPSYVWAMLMAVACTLALHLFDLLPAGFFIHILLISLIEALTSANLNMLVGKERIKPYNIIAMFQYIALLLVVILFYMLLGQAEVMSYVWAMYISVGLAMIMSFVAVSRYFGEFRIAETGASVRAMFRFGSYVQTAGLLHLLNLRLSYFFIDSWVGRSALGVFDVNSKINDGIWLPGRSIALVQYSAISNSDDPEYARSLSLSLWKVLIMVTMAMTLVFALLPAGFYTMIFGKEFSEVKRVLLLMIPGVLAMASNTIFSHYFSGRGKHYMNTIGSGLGLLLTVAFGVWLIPSYGIVGAALTASISYVLVSIYSMFFFFRISGAGGRELLPSRNDLREAVKLFRRVFSSRD